MKVELFGQNVVSALFVFKLDTSAKAAVFGGADCIQIVPL